MRRQFHLYRGMCKSAACSLALALCWRWPAWPIRRRRQAAFADPAFQRNWERTDKPVADEQGRPLVVLGAEPRLLDHGAEQGRRRAGSAWCSTSTRRAWRSTTQRATRASAFYVTNGLLATELMSGRMQTGDGEFQPRCAAEIPAGLGHGRRQRADLCHLRQADERAEDQRRSARTRRAWSTVAGTISAGPEQGEPAGRESGLL